MRSKESIEWTWFFFASLYTYIFVSVPCFYIAAECVFLSCLVKWNVNCAFFLLRQGIALYRGRPKCVFRFGMSTKATKEKLRILAFQRFIITRTVLHICYCRINNCCLHGTAFGRYFKAKYATKIAGYY